MSEITEAATPQGQDAETATATQPEAQNPDGQELANVNSEEKQEDQQKADEPAVPKGLQKRLDKLTRQMNDERRLNERLIGLLERSAVNGSAPAMEKTPEGPPRRDHFETVEDYLEAKADWQIANKLEQIKAEAEASKARQEAAKREASWQKRVQQAAAKYEDFEELVSNDELEITPVMAEAIKEIESGPDVAYYLASNPEEAARIRHLSPVAQVREIGKIEARLNGQAESVKRASKAPPPIEPVTSPKSSSSDPAHMSQAEYEAWRKKSGAFWAR